MFLAVGRSSVQDIELILIPVYDDWEAVGLLLERLDREVGHVPGRTHVVLIDDGSAISSDALPPRRYAARACRVRAS